MKPCFRFGSLIAGGAFGLLAAQAAHAATTAIQSVELNKTQSGMELLLSTKQGDTPQIFAISQDNVLQADITQTQLDLPRGKTYRKQNPAAGIKSIQLKAIDSDTVRLTIQGKQQAPVANLEKTSEGILVSLDTRSGAVAKSSSVPSQLETVAPAAPPLLAQADDAETPDVDILIPNPEVIIDGAPVTAPTLNGAPPFLPRAVAPPVGDIAVSDINAGLDVIDLGTAERVPRLVLREAPAREVLSLLARTAGLNLAFTDASDGEGDSSSDVRVTLDIENEPVQNVFNYVLQISGLEANRVGRTIFVGPRLPLAARNTVLRSVRVNQVDVATAVNFLVFMGAESALQDQQEVTTVIATTEAGDEVEEVERTELETDVDVLRADYEDASPILRGLQVIGDARTSSVTLIGTPRQVEIATAQLVQLDLRRRQVAINVRVVDVDLNALENFDSSFSFSVNDTFVRSSGGVANLDFGLNPFNVLENFILSLSASVVSGTSKIITDPTLIVQEGQDAAISLVEEVVSQITVTFNDTSAGTRETREVEFSEVGLTLQINVDRIDDNGFVSLSVAPSISAPLPRVEVDDETDAFVTPIATRALSSGLVRVRDGQTLVLSGIIQETDRVTVTKVPILGDLPLIGALFRDSSNENDRRELVVLLTPQILDDSDQSIYGYSYTPGEDVRELLGE